MAVLYVTRVPNRGSPSAVLLRESYREGGKAKNRTLANLSSWPEAKVKALAAALKGLLPAGLDGMVEITRSLPYGHVAAVSIAVLRCAGRSRSRWGQLARVQPLGLDVRCYFG